MGDGYVHTSIFFPKKEYDKIINERARAKKKLQEAK